MDLVTILRQLMRRRRSVLVAFLVAVLAAVAVMYKLPALKSRSHDVGVASAQILLDTPSSQVVDVAPKGADTLGVRANLLAGLMVDGAVRDEIAHSAGLTPSQLASTTDSTTDATPGASLTAPQSGGSQQYLLTTHILSDATNDPLPIIEVDTQAPTAAGAVRLAQAAVAGLKAYLDSTAAGESIPDTQRLQITSLGVPQGTTETRGPTKTIGVLVLILVFVLGCGGILAGSALRRRWRAAAEQEQLEAEGSARPTDSLPLPDAYALAGGGPKPLDSLVKPTDATGGHDPIAAARQPAEIVSAAEEVGERRAPVIRSMLLRRRVTVEIADGASTGDPDPDVAASR